MSDSRLQEILTRAVVGRAEQSLTWCHKAAAGEMTQVLGVRVGKTAVAVKNQEGTPSAELMVECDLWCSDGEHTKVIRTRSRTVHAVPIALKGEVLGEESLQIALVTPPRSTGVRVEEGTIYADFTATVEVELSALTRLWIRVYDVEYPPGASDWDESATGDTSSSSYGSH